MKLFHNLFFTCKEASYLVVLDQKKISFTQRLRFKVHVVFCKSCKVFATQNKLINQLLKDKFAQDANKKLTPEQHKRISTSLARKIKM